MKAAFPAFLALLALSACGPNQAADAIMDRYVQAWGQADPHALAAIYAPDGVLTDPTGAQHTGRGAIESFYAAAFAQGYAGRPAHARIVRADQHDGLVTATGAWRIDPASNATGGAECGASTLTARRAASSWEIVSLRETAGPCVGGN